MKRILRWLLLGIALVALTACGGGSSGSNTSSSNGDVPSSGVQKRTISGYVVDDPVSNAEVYIDFGDGTISTKATTKSDGSFEIELSDEDLAKINPEVPEGADAPIDDLLIVAKKDGRILRNAISRDINNTGTVYITNDTEAYAEFLESIGAFDASSLLSFNDELQNGRIKDNSKYATLIKDLREDVKNYFYGGEQLDKKAIFEKALQDLDKSELATIADDKSILLIRNIVSGGDIILPNDVNVSSDDITITSKGNGRYTLGDSNDADETVYLKISKSDGTFALIPVNIKSQTITEVAKRSITPTEGATLGSDEDVKVIIPPFALNETKEITIKKIETEGESADGKKILDLEPKGTQFQVPITIKINYADFGIDDPYAVQWKYGSLDEGYDDADIVGVDTTKKVIYLNVDHFSGLVIKKINEGEFLDLGPKYSILIPNRSSFIFSHTNRYGRSYTTNVTNVPFYNPYYDNNLKEYDNYKIITNRVFPGMSFSSRHGESSFGGGQCVQFDFNVYWAYRGRLLTNAGRSKQAKNIYSNLLRRTTNKFKNVRLNINQCQIGDIVIYPYIFGITGHVAIFYRYDNSNNLLKILESNKGHHYDYPNMRETFNISSYDDINNSYYLIEDNNTYLTSGKNKFLCVSPDYFTNNNSSNLVIHRRATILSNESFHDNGFSNSNYSNSIIEKPYLYYLLHLPDGITLDNNNRKINGISQINNSYSYDPFLLPVAPLRVSFTDNVGKIQNYEDARYEIYAEYKDGATFKTSDGVDLKYSDTNITLPSTFGDNIKLTRLALTQDSNKTSLTMVANNFNRNVEVSGISSPIKMLFSPIVIDDYYVNWGKDNDNHNIPIGFWNSKGYSLIHTNENDQFYLHGECGAYNLNPGNIYKCEDAVNGYFMTLGDGESAEWHFALVGPHAIYVNVPTKNINDIKNAKFSLYSSGTKSVDLVPISSNISALEGLEGSSFDGWVALKTEDGHVSFNLTGDEYLKVTSNSGTVVVDAVRLEGRKDRIENLIILDTLVDVADSADREALMCKLIVKNLGNNKEKSILIPFGTQMKINFRKALNRPLNLQFCYFPIKKQSGFNRSLNRDNGDIETKYKPVIQNVTINPDETSKNIPPVTLQPYGKKDNVKLHLINAIDGSAIRDANVTIRYGIDNDDNQSVAYSGVTDENGYFEITNMPYGQFTAVFSKDGFISTSLNMKIDEDSNSNYDLSMSPALAQGEMRIRLSWGENPSDLDSHLVKYVNGNQEYHIYYGHKNGTNGDNLDRDDTTSYGPETVTIKDVNTSAKYVYFVHKYAGSGDIKNSGASVKVSYGDSEQTFYPPQEDGIYWKVFTIENGTIIPCNSNCMGNDSNEVSRNLKRFDALFRNLPIK